MIIKKSADFLLMSLLISLLLSFQAGHSAKNSLTAQLLKDLPPLINTSLNNSVDEQLELTRMGNKLLTMLSAVNLESVSPIKLIEQLHVSQISLLKLNDISDYQGVISWPFGEHYIALKMVSKPDYLLVNIAIVSVLLTSICFWLAGVLNRLCTAIELTWRKKLNNSHLAPEDTSSYSAPLNENDECSALFNYLSSQTSLVLSDIKTLCQNDEVTLFDSKQQAWLVLAINNGLTLSAAVEAVKQGDLLVFDLTHHQLIIHGIPIALAKTPLFYYYWYAQRKLNNQAPYINPPVNKPDQVVGQQLAQLMADHQGHQKAIRDLQEEGLKGKTLDQNRNKIKIALQKSLGELAEGYLFYSERDVKTARYKYNLIIDKADIKVI